MSFDAVAGEVERGTLPLLLTYPVARWEVLAGKFFAHLAIFFVAILAGYGAAAGVTILADPLSISGLGALWTLTWTSTLLGARFLGIGYAVSASARRVSGAAGLAFGLWLGLVVLYDLGLLAAVVADDGGAFTTDVFPFALLANPAVVSWPSAPPQSRSRSKAMPSRSKHGKAQPSGRRRPCVWLIRTQKRSRNRSRPRFPGWRIFSASTAWTARCPASIGLAALQTGPLNCWNVFRWQGPFTGRARDGSTQPFSRFGPATPKRLRWERRPRQKHFKPRVT